MSGTHEPGRGVPGAALVTGRPHPLLPPPSAWDTGEAVQDGGLA